jgi:pimeloyl-ACP methyl ester carboxylesterase
MCTHRVVSAAVLGAEFSGGAASAGQYVRVSPDLELYYEEVGSGAPIIFIPGWIGTTEFWQQQMVHFSKRYRAISYDPRSQGRSSKTPENNNYTQHGADLKAFMDALNLKNVILVCQSWGCHDAYAYFRAYGTENVRALVCIDQGPKDIIEQVGDWGSIRSAIELKAFHDGMVYDRLKTLREFVQTFVTRPLTEAEKNWFVDQMVKTPTYAAVLLNYDGTLADYTAEAKMIDGKIPVLNVLADPGWYQGWTDAAKTWLAENAPHSEIVVFGLHLMNWEFPDKFNAAVDAFIERVVSKEHVRPSS